MLLLLIVPSLLLGGCQDDGDVYVTQDQGVTIYDVVDVVDVGAGSVDVVFRCPKDRGWARGHKIKVCKKDD